MSGSETAIEAQAYIHHQYLLGLELMVATTKGPEVVGEWMFRLFRRQHEEKFLSSFEKLGLAGAALHCLFLDFRFYGPAGKFEAYEP